jgi:shikimate kinase
MKNIALIGPRGVGKSKISKRLSKLTGKPVLSIDSIAIYELGGKTIADFVAENNGNWKPFRDLEYKILKNLENSKGLILDCGGGILFDTDENGNEVVSEKKVDLLRTMAEVVFLDNELEALINKVANDSTRPDLSAKESYQEILQRRIPIYKESAHFRLFLGDLKKESAAQRIIDLTGFK